jgi:hypothetical protein
MELINPEDPDRYWIAFKSVLKERYFDTEAEARQLAQREPQWAIEPPVPGRAA